MKFFTSLRKFGAVALGTVVLGASRALAQTATIPDTTEMTTKLTAIGGVAAAGAAVGFSIWIYRKVKAKAGQAVG